MLVSLAGPSEAQERETPGLTDFPVPAWPKDGVIPEAMKDKYVFIDLETNQYVLTYPENVGTESFEKDGPGPRKMARYDLMRNVEPAISVALTPLAEGKFRYVYTVANAASAKQPLDQFGLVLPAQGAETVIRAPEGFYSIVQKSRQFKLRYPEWIRSGSFALWSFAKPEAILQAGASRTGFELESDLKPGFTVGYFRRGGHVDAKVATSGNVPKPVKDQLDPLLVLEYDSKTLLTIAPKFEKAAEFHVIAADFAQGIELLARMGALTNGSDFVRTTLAELRRIQPGAASGVTFTATPGTPLETEILSALKLAF